MGALLDGVFSGTDFGNTNSVLMIGLNPNVGDLLHSFLRKRAGLAVSVFLVCVCDDQTESTWLETSTIEAVAEDYENGTLVPVGGSLAKDIEDEVLESLPALHTTCRRGRGPHFSKL